MLNTSRLPGQRRQSISRKSVLAAYLVRSCFRTCRTKIVFPLPLAPVTRNARPMRASVMSRYPSRFFASHSTSGLRLRRLRIDVPR
jgi:hypothetical protein